MVQSSFRQTNQRQRTAPVYVYHPFLRIRQTTGAKMCIRLRFQLRWDPAYAQRCEEVVQDVIGVQWFEVRKNMLEDSVCHPVNVSVVQVQLLLKLRKCRLLSQTFKAPT